MQAGDIALKIEVRHAAIPYGVSTKPRSSGLVRATARRR